MHRQPLRLPVQVQRVAIEMVIGRNEVRVSRVGKEVNHAMKLARQIDVVVLCEIDDVGILLFQKDIDLPTECRLIANATEIQEGKVSRVEELPKEIRVFWRTSI